MNDVRMVRLLNDFSDYATGRVMAAVKLDLEALYSGG